MLYLCGKQFNRFYYTIVVKNTLILRFETKLKAKRGRKRKAVRQNPNNTFARIKEIKAAQEALQASISASEAAEAAVEIIKDKAEASNYVIVD